MAPPPLDQDRLRRIVTEACETTLEHVDTYVHSSTAVWNSSIINKILKRLIEETTPPNATQPPFKYIVNSTIIQQLDSTSDGKLARRGMHSAAGAYWNNDKDGMWSLKYDFPEDEKKKVMEVVISVIWIKV